MVNDDPSSLSVVAASSLGGAGSRSLGRYGAGVPGGGLGGGSCALDEATPEKRSDIEFLNSVSQDNGEIFNTVSPKNLSSVEIRTREMPASIEFENSQTVSVAEEDLLPYSYA